MSEAFLERLPSLFDAFCRAGFPEEAASELVSKTEIYRHKRDRKRDELTPGETREHLAEVGTAVRALTSVLESLPMASWRALRDAAHNLGTPDVLDRASEALRALEVVLACAWADIEPRDGAPASLRAWLIIAFATTLEAHSISSAPGCRGELYKAVRIAFSAVGEGALHFDKLIKNAFVVREENTSATAPV